MLDQISDAGLDVLGVGKIYDIFAGKGVTDSVRTTNNDEGVERLIERMNKDFTGLCFVNLVDFDMVYGHRNDIDGYAKALSRFDEQLPRIIDALRDEDILIITADHGCDPSTPSTDHSREYVPMIAYGKQIKKGNNIGTRDSFSDIAATVLEYLDIKQQVAGKSFLQDILEG
jgi:phosphopentomutase